MLYYFKYDRIRHFISSDRKQRCYDTGINYPSLLSYTWKLEHGGKYHFWDNSSDIKCQCCGKFNWKNNRQWKLIN